MFSFIQILSNNTRKKVCFLFCFFFWTQSTYCEMPTVLLFCFLSILWSLGIFCGLPFRNIQQYEFMLSLNLFPRQHCLWVLVKQYYLQLGKDLDASRSIIWHSYGSICHLFSTTLLKYVVYIQLTHSDQTWALPSVPNTLLHLKDHSLLFSKQTKVWPAEV